MRSVYSVSVTRSVAMLWKKLSTGPRRSWLLPPGFNTMVDCRRVCLIECSKTAPEDSPELADVRLCCLVAAFLNQACVDGLNSCRAGKGCAGIYFNGTELTLMPKMRFKKKKGALGSFTWTGAGWVLAEVLS